MMAFAALRSFCVVNLTSDIGLSQKCVFRKFPNSIGAVPLSFKIQERAISFSRLSLQKSVEGEETEGNETETTSKVDPSKDRSRTIPFDVSIRYMESEAYRDTYGDTLVWKLYRRAHKNQFPPRKTRKTCIRNNVISTGSPCPICRDEYLVPDYRNVKLLKQFVSPYSGEVIDAYYTGVCRKQHFLLQVHVEKARDYGYLDFFVPKRYYDYEDYFPQSSNLDSINKTTKN